MKNDYNLWEPLIDIPYDDLFFFETRDELDSLVICLKVLGQDERILKIRFERVLGYRIIQESARIRSIGESESLNKFRTSTNSEFIKWFRDESIGQFDDWDLCHYIICNTDNIIDVITGLPVSVDWVPA